MDIFCICRTCLNEPSTNLVSIYEEINLNQGDLNDSNTATNKNNQKQQISNILDAFTANKYVCIISFILYNSFNMLIFSFLFICLFQNSIQFPYPDKICESCLNDLKTAVEFKHQCENVFEQLIKLEGVSIKLSDEIVELQPALDTEKPIFVDATLNSTLETIEKIEPLNNITCSKIEVNSFAYMY